MCGERPHIAAWFEYTTAVCRTHVANEAAYEVPRFRYFFFSVFFDLVVVLRARAGDEACSCIPPTSRCSRKSTQCKYCEVIANHGCCSYSLALVRAPRSGVHHSRWCSPTLLTTPHPLLIGVNVLKTEAHTLLLATVRYKKTPPHLMDILYFYWSV